MAPDPKPDPRLRGILALALASFLISIVLGLWRIAVTRGFPLPGLPPALPPHGQWMVGGFLAALIMLERFAVLPIRRYLWVPYLYVITGLLLPSGGPVVRGLHGLAWVGWMLHRYRAFHAFGQLGTPLLEGLAFAMLSVALVHPLGFGQRWDLALAGLLFAVTIIAGERLDLALRMHRRGARATLAGLFLLQGWATTSMLWGPWPAPAWGLLLLLLGLGLVHADTGLKRIHPSPPTGATFHRYLRTALWTAYGWLFVAALMLLAWPNLPGAVQKDLTYHALGLGFIFTMILAHGPIILHTRFSGRMPERGPVRAFWLFQVATLLRLAFELTVPWSVGLWAWSGWTTGILHFTALTDMVLSVRRAARASAIRGPSHGATRSAAI